MGKTMKTGFTSTSRTSPLAPTSTNPGMPQGVVGGSPSAAPERGALRKKGGSKGGVAGAKANRQGVLERQGARQRIEVPLYPAQAPEAAATQANGRIIKSLDGKMRDAWSGGQFWDASRGG